MVRIEIYTSHDYLGEFVVNLNTKCGVPVASLRVLRQCMPTHALSFTKHRQPMFNYYNSNNF